ncbi:DUF6597 domain-containing transcriptional factor [Paenibacillus alkalitolerans]|uniref:DUF6597 domain-containing transcriptional factor n=1 Tax=Paenibacillus alkalitolerans TaxID=2799335 RepID=UPI0018F71CA7|nr:DUF6597 domain-containing transcriptional factor [Paenibacillus alkalitolerans]
MGSGSNPPGAKELTLPDGSVNLVIDLSYNKIHILHYNKHETTLEPSIICGPHTDYFIADSERERTMIGVHFIPGRAGAFLKMPSAELYNLHISLCD